jgi:hypothetical protein
MKSGFSLPNALTITCRHDGIPGPDMFAMMTLLMDQKNHYNFPLGPADDLGIITITDAQIQSEVKKNRDAFPMDYDDLASFAGEIQIGPMDLTQVEAALRAYDVYRSVVAYPAGYRDALVKCWQTLYKLQPIRLDVEVSIQPPTSNVVVSTESIVAGGLAHHVPVGVIP